MLTGNYEYSRSNRDNLQLPIQIKFSKNASTFYTIALKFLVVTWNFQCSEKKNERHRSSIFEVIDSERRAYLNV